MLKAYVDESGTHDQKVTCVAGLLYTRKNIKNLERAWKRALDCYGLEYFHSTEANGLKGQFRNSNPARRDEACSRFVGMLPKYASGGAFAYITGIDDFKVYKKKHVWNHSQYATCAYACVVLLQDIARDLEESEVDITFETGVHGQGDLKIILEKMQDSGEPLTFGTRDKKFRPLQTADILAYEGWKRLRGSLDGHKIRDSLVSLLVGIPENALKHIPVNAESLPTIVKQIESFLTKKRRLDS